METVPLRVYEANVTTNRYLNMIAIVLLLGFLVWWTSELSTSAFYFLTAITAYLSFVITRSCFAESEYIGNAKRRNIAQRAVTSVVTPVPVARSQ